MFWLAFIALLNSETLDMEWGPMSKENGTWQIPLVFGMAINALLFYANTYYFIPNYLHKKNYKKFWTKSVLLVVGFTAVEYIFDNFYLYGKAAFHDILFSAEVYSTTIDHLIFFTSTFIFNTFFWAMAFLYRWPKDWMRNERQKQQLKQDKLTAELEFLKAQINPHFLFNGINSIYHLIGEDTSKAQKVLLKFSDLLRYQLYECKEGFIPLKKELNYLKNYLGIETVRKEEDAVIVIEWPRTNELENLNGLKIAPLLLTPFLENAFKYLSLHAEKEKNQLEVKLNIANNRIHLFVKNTFDPLMSKQKNKGSSGIGLQNVKRRLALLYPAQHQLSAAEKNGSFEIDLKINLS